MTDENKTKEELQQEAVQQLLKLGKGKMVLAVPLTADDREVTELEYDFVKFTGAEYADVLDKAAAPFVAGLTNRQCLLLFAHGVQKATPGVDEGDVRDRLSAIDAVQAMQVTKAFFMACSRVGRISSTNE